MSKGQNGSVYPKENGKQNGISVTCPAKHNVQVMSQQSSWTSLPDVFLILFPTALLLVSGNEDGISSHSMFANG